MSQCQTVLTRNVLIAVAVAVSVSATQKPTSDYRAPRAADGHPDLNGIWQAMNTAHFDLETHVARPAMALREGPHGPVPAAPVIALGAVGAVPGGLSVVEDGAIPYKPDALAEKKENQEHWLDRDPEIKCYLPGVPRATYMPYPFQIFHSATDIFIAYEYAGAVRDILLEDPGPPPVDSWMGQSVGHWEGETLVVDTTNFVDTPGLYYATENLHVVERFTRIGPDTILYQFTVDDPTVWTEPWTGEYPWRSTADPMFEYACHEANYSFEGILRGARLLEEEAMQKKSDKQ